MAKEVVIKLTVDSKGAVTGIRSAEGALVQLDRSADRAASGGVSRLMGALKAAAAYMAVERIIAYTRRLFDLGTAAAETADAFVRVFEGGAQALDDFISTWARTAGMTRTEAREMSVALGGLGRGLDMTGEQAANFSKDVLTLAGDIASMRNVPIQDVLQSIQSGIAGETEPMRRYGVFLKEATVQAEAMRNRAKGLTGELSEQEKALARLRLMQQGTAAANDNLAQTQDSAANAARRHLADLREMEQTFAVMLLPAFGLVLDQLGQVIEENDATGRSFAEKLARGVLYSVGALIAGGRAIGQVGQAIAALGGAIRRAFGGGASDLGVMQTMFRNTLNEFDRFTISLLEKQQTLDRALLAINRMRLGFARAIVGIAREGSDAFVRYTGMVEQLTEAVAQGETALAGSTRLVNQAWTRIANRGMPGRSMLGAGVEEGLASLSELAEMALPDIEAIFREAGEAAVRGTEDASKKAEAARRKAAERAERERRQAVDREFENREIRIRAMAEGTDRTVAQIRLGADREREAYRRSYGPMAGQVLTDFNAAMERAEREALHAPITRLVGARMQRLLANPPPLPVEAWARALQAGAITTIEQADTALAGLAGAMERAGTADERANIAGLTRKVGELRDRLRADGGEARDVAAWEAMLGAGAVRSIREAEAALSSLGVALETATDPAQRAKITALITEFQRLRDTMTEGGRSLDDVATDFSGGMLRSLNDVDMALSILSAGLENATDDEQRAQITRLIAEIERLKAAMESAARVAPTMGAQIANGVGIAGDAFGVMAGMARDAYQSAADEARKSGGNQEEAGRAAFVNYKRLASAQAVIDTLASAQAAYRSMAVFGPIAGGAAAAVALLAGYARVRQINAQQIGGSSSGSGGGYGRAPGASSVSGSLALGASVAMGGGSAPRTNSSAPAPVVNVPPAPVPIVEIHASAQGLFSTVRYGEAQTTRLHGAPSRRE